jgi:hypothetical protein
MERLTTVGYKFLHEGASSCSERSRNSIRALKAESTISKFQERDHAHDRRNSSSLRHGI